jgi:serine-type D-Ala-D-Ala carboxypeptidase (penicillin-binding protein 5/6)
MPNQSRLDTLHNTIIHLCSSLSLLAATLTISTCVSSVRIYAQTPTTINSTALSKEPNALEETLAEKLLPLIEKHPGKVTVAIRHLESGASYFYHAEEPMPTASLIKLPTLIAFYRQVDSGVLSPDKLVTLTQADKVPGSGILTSHFSPGSQLSLETIARLMITYSDNTATNLIADHIGLSATTVAMKELGLQETQLHSKVFRRDTSIAPERSQKYGLGSTTAAEMLRLLELLHRNEVASEESCEKILAHLLTCDDRSKLMRFLPESIQGYHKTGAVNESRTDAGLFHTPNGSIAMVVLTSENQDKSWGNSNAAEILIGKIALTTFETLFPQTSDDLKPQVLKLGSNGVLVEALQNALNSQLNPSPNLSVDGDFGGMTEKAVQRFQTAQEIEPNGIVGPETWSKLGEINIPSASQTPKQPLANPQPADRPLDLPNVSCKAWLVADASTGDILAGENQDTPMEIASTTKMMTAWLIAKEIATQPELLDETILFSVRADKTPGSSSTIRAGESLSIRDALYGLMLPSGNDAAVALAEWWGSRHSNATASIAGENDPFNRFVQAMNDEAKRLELHHTSFRNPHGLPHAEHRSSCVDLLRLARTMMQDELIRKVVSTRRHECTVQGTEGYTRRIQWDNTNQLLDIEGYLGIKTGTTDAAGACLVSWSRHPSNESINKESVVIVLGASGSAARYSDSRNLHRWSWKQMSP